MHCRLLWLVGISIVLRRTVNLHTLNTLRPRQNGRHFPDDKFKHIFFNENVWIPITISLKFVPNGLINKIPSLVQIMAWRWLGDKPLSEPMMVSLLTLICVTRPQWVKVRQRQRPPRLGGWMDVWVWVCWYRCQRVGLCDWIWLYLLQPFSVCSVGWVWVIHVLLRIIFWHDVKKTSQNMILSV